MALLCTYRFGNIVSHQVLCVHSGMLLNKHLLKTPCMRPYDGCFYMMPHLTLTVIIWSLEACIALHLPCSALRGPVSYSYNSWPLLSTNSLLGLSTERHWWKSRVGWIKKSYFSCVLCLGLHLLYGTSSHGSDR